MTGVIQKILPREGKYFDLFTAHADVLVAAADALAQLLKGDALDECLDQIRKLDMHMGDTVVIEPAMCSLRSVVRSSLRSTGARSHR